MPRLRFDKALRQRRLRPQQLGGLIVFLAQQTGGVKQDFETCCPSFWVGMSDGSVSKRRAETSTVARKS